MYLANNNTAVFMWHRHHSHTYYRTLVLTPVIVAIVAAFMFNLVAPVLLGLSYDQDRRLNKIKSLLGKWSRPIVKSYFSNLVGVFSKASSEDAGATEQQDEEEDHEELRINGTKVDLLTLTLLSMYFHVAVTAIVTIIWLSLFIQISYACDNNLDCFTIVVDDDGSEISATPVNDCSLVNNTICYKYGINSNALVELGGLYTTFKLIPAIYSYVVLKLYYIFAYVFEKCTTRKVSRTSKCCALLKMFYYPLFGCGFLSATIILGTLVLTNENYHLKLPLDLCLKIFWVCSAILICSLIPWGNYVSPRKGLITNVNSHNYGSLA